ncbi:hypothetical protein [Horticoccus sp. 23ND18S-11]|uniref:hypothetical protein n=1 Tax=Horticoccus sp. 23ND18S-11 TaxID=3391832 RepID=UPI0039C98A42
MRLRERQAQMQEEESARQQQKFQILAPAMRAKQAADIADAQTHVVGLEQTEAARAAASSVIPKARAEFDEIMQLSDPDSREQAGLEWIGRYGHLDNVQAYSKEFDAKKNVVAKMHTEATALRHLTQSIAGQKEVAKVRGDTAIEVAGTRAAAGDKIGRYRASLEEARQAGDDEGVALYENLLQKAQASPINTAYGSEQMQRKLEAARAAGDPEETAFWEKRIKALTERGVRKGLGLDDPRAAAFLAAPVAGPGTSASTPPTPKSTSTPNNEPARIRVKLSDLK